MVNAKKGENVIKWFQGDVTGRTVKSFKKIFTRIKFIGYVSFSFVPWHASDKVELIN